MCDINCIWLFNLLVAFVLIIQQQQHHAVVVGLKLEHKRQHQKQQEQHLEQDQRHHQKSPYSDITSYATVLATKYLHQHSLPKANVVKREIKNDKNTDFITYLSDFNMQDETTIPEDIFDQRHLQEIEEERGQHRMEGAKGGESVDIIDVNLPYDDSDADAEADIILESQRSSERNFNSSDDTNNNGDEANNPGIVYMTQVRPGHVDGVTKVDNLRKTFNKKDIFKEKSKPNLSPGGIDRKKSWSQQRQQEVKYESTSPRYTYDFQETDLSSFGPVDNYEDALDDDEEDDDDGSAEYERFKYMHEKKLREQKEAKEREEQKQKQQLQQNLHQQAADVKDNDGVEVAGVGGRGQLSLIKKLNERKFNKPSMNENEKLSSKDENDHGTADGDDHHDDNGSYDTDNDEDNAYNDSKADKNVDVDTDDNGANIDYDRHSIRKQQKQQQQQTQRQTFEQQQEQHQPSQDAIGDIAVEENDENQSSWQVSKTDEKNDFFIPRKMKRHNGAARLDDATNRYTRIKQERQQQEHTIQLQRHMNTPLSPSPPRETIANSDNSKADDSQEEYMSHYRRVTKEPNFQKSYYGRTNGNVSQTTSNAEGHQQQSQHQQQPQQLLKAENQAAEYSFTATNGNNNDANGQKSNEQQQNDSDGSSRVEMSVAKTTAASDTTTTNEETADEEENKRLALLEREKSLRRKHYGHKIHKKKYKDYQHYHSVMMMRQHPTTATTAMTATVSTQTSFPAMTTSSPSPEEKTSKTPTVTKLIKMDNANRNDGDNLRYHKDKYSKKLKMERSKAMMPPSPIFVLKSTRRGGEGHDTSPTALAASKKPFYEGQINYYLETEDDDDARGNEARFITKGDRMDTNDWYRKLSPVLRNGVKTSANHQEDRTPSGSGMGRPGAATPYHHLRNHHQKHHHHQHNQQHHHHHSRNHAYQRKMIPKKMMATTTPLPPPSRKHSTTADDSSVHELAHQITDLKEFERYYAKWPHLARVQSQLHDEQLREQLELQNLQQQQLSNYQDYEYDEDYFEALQGIRSPLGSRDLTDNAEENLPPYIRKYNRRNKQLLDLLEGTLPPPTRPPQQLRWAGSKLQPGPRDSSTSSSSVGSMSVRIDDDYLKEKRKRYHQRQKQIHDLFEEQRATTSTTTAPATVRPTTSYSYDHPQSHKESQENSNRSDNSEPELENHLPDEDVSISMETAEEQQQHQGTNWQKEIASKSTSSSTSTAFSASSSKTGNLPIHWQQMEKLITPATRMGANGGGAGGDVQVATAPATAVMPVTPKPAMFKLPSYPSIAGSYIQRPRSRSAQFAPSSGSEFRRVTPSIYTNNNNNFINAGGFVAYNGHGLSPKSMTARFTGNSSATTILTPTTNTSNKSNNKDNAASVKSSSTSNRSLSRSLPSSSSSSSPASVSNSFVYHRVVDASPRLVGAGLTGRKQRLPFVAITDRRLETSKKSLTDHQKDFEQNHYPLP
ncbi:uncharacterized protein [Musca autumnalis]|uniref:uncharacterized protein n=1 Tax=Musca autumnalis TaxID=221902 RepID=UPI003CF6D84B